jgi:hypothetical protein
MTPDPWGFADGPNLYCYCHNNPFSFIDWIGLASEEFGRKGGGWDPPMKLPPKLPPRGGGPGPGYDFGRSDHPPNPLIKYYDNRSPPEPKAKAPKLHLPQRTWTTTCSGGTRAFWGGLEMHTGIGLCATGVLAPVGILVALHGFDQYVAGVRTAWTGTHKDTLTCWLLQQSGMSSRWASASSRLY